MSRRTYDRDVPRVGPVAAAVFNVPVMAIALALCYLGLWLAQPRTVPAEDAAASPDAVAAVEPVATDESARPSR